MCSSDLKHNIKRKLITDRKAEKYIKDPRFVARMAKLSSIPVIKKYDVPYLCGYSTDAKKIYFDVHLKTKMRGVDITKFLKIHEYSEKALLDIFDMDYQQAHHIATHLERKAVKEAGISWKEYDEYLKPFIKEVSREHLDIVPPDLDLEPYSDEKDSRLLTSLKSKEKSENDPLKSIQETRSEEHTSELQSH